MPKSKSKQEKKLVRVTMEYSDGQIQMIEGDAAEAWIKDVNDKVTDAFLHGSPLGEHKWITVKK